MSNKLGLGILGGWSGNLGRPAVVKLVNVSLQYVAQVRSQVGPECLIIVRFEFDNPALDNPEAAARAWFDRRLGDMCDMWAVGGPNIAFETAINECPDELVPAYVRFLLTLLPLMHTPGLRSVVGNPSVGCWKETTWPQLKPVTLAMRPGDLFGLHEYWSDGKDLGNPYHVGRWRVDGIREVLVGVPLVVTECGRDFTPDTGKGKPGWKRTTNAETFFDELCRYNDEILVPDPRVFGATVYGAGTDRKWERFDPSEIWPWVVSYRGAEGPAVVPPKPPTPIEEEPVSAGPIKQMPSPNYGYLADGTPKRGTPGRNGYKPIAVVLHRPEGSLAQTDSYCRQAGSAVAYHCCIDHMTGEIHQYVDFSNAAYQAGVVEAATWPLLIEGQNPNLYTIGVAISGYSGDPISEAAYRSLLWLLGEVILPQHEIAPGPDTLIGHCRISGTRRANCPGPSFRWAQMFVDLNPAPLPDLAAMATDARWNVEQAVRELEAGGLHSGWPGMARLHSLIRLDGGLLYKLENALRER